MTTPKPSVSTLLPVTGTSPQLRARQNSTPTVSWITSTGITPKTAFTSTATPGTTLSGVTSPGTFLNLTHRTTSEVFYNGTGYYIEAEEELGLNDWQTLFLACVITLISLVFILLVVFGIRVAWKKYRKCKHNSQYDGIIRREGTSESLSRPLHSHLTDKVSCRCHSVLYCCMTKNI
ncbi:unnamed protein product [Acanthoscelides obtectus]|uniref:Uncharacterized protein n=1 Tax=Acanthoscelides obtectus TaxID=200917 RepID=A0A9P0JSB9_ACAOB|nr:unnamed protein product [Acanthoscelides obtectus]CAK1665696.1 hypothetical protein AOBTE_LOCUS24923 [Acanthoscelides obtectus]